MIEQLTAELITLPTDNDFQILLERYRKISVKDLSLTDLFGLGFFVDGNEYRFVSHPKYADYYNEVDKYVKAHHSLKIAKTINSLTR